MGIGESRSGSRQSIDMRCLGVGMPTHEPDPVILIVNRDHKNVRLVSSIHEEPRQGQKENYTGFGQ